MATSIIKQVTNNSGTGYCKMPDGTLICWGNKTIPLTASHFINWSTADIKRADLGDNNYIPFPVSFASPPAVSATINNDAWAFVLTVRASTTAIYEICIARQTAYEGSYNLGWIAIGRWK